MGGHGGLNILPQKSWNVYNYKNRRQVQDDEEKHEEEQKEKQERALKAEAEARIGTLRRIAKRKLHGIEANNDTVKLSIADELVFGGAPPGEAKQLKHSEEHTKEKKEEEFNKLKRQNVIGLLSFKDSIGDAQQPWYLKDRTDTNISVVYDLPTSSSCSTLTHPPQVQRGHKEKHHSHHHKRHHRRHKKIKISSDCPVRSAAVVPIDILRAERLAREKAEQIRVASLTGAGPVEDIESRSGRRYNSGYMQHPINSRR